MKYAFMTFSCPDLTFDEVLALAKRLGYDGVEPRISNKHLHGVEPESSPQARRGFRRKAEESGVALCCLATSHRYADPATNAAETEATVRSVELAADVGSPRIRVFGGNVPEGVSREQAIDLLVASLTRVADRCKDLPVTICMETHDAWCDPAHVVEVMRRVDRPNVAVNWDIMHPVRTGKKSIQESFDALWPWTKHVHFHDGIWEGADLKLRMVPIGEGMVDHAKAVQLLQDAKYDGYLSGEWIRWEPWETHLPRELAAMKALER